MVMKHTCDYSVVRHLELASVGLDFRGSGIAKVV